MIALDTNVIVRFLVRDDAAQARRAKALIDGLTDREERAYVSDIVLCELTWVLGRSYRFDRSRVVPVIAALVQSKQLHFDSLDNVLRALSAYEHGRGDFADYLIREQARSAKCEAVVTFDEKLLEEDSFVQP